MGGCLNQPPKELKINTEIKSSSNNNINASNNETLNNESSNNQNETVNTVADVPIILGDLVTSYNDIDSKRQRNINNLLTMIPNTIQILLNSNYEKELFNIYLETRVLVKLRYEEYKNMEHQFNLIDEIIIKIEKQIQTNIYNSILLTKTAPRILIDTLKICEFEDNDHNNNNFKTLYHSCHDWTTWRQSTTNESNDEKKEALNVITATCTVTKDSMQSKVKSEIESFILNSVETLYNHHEIKKCLSGIDDIIIDLNDINNKMSDIFPKHYDIINYFIGTYYQLFKGLLCMKLDDNKIETQNTLFVIAWIDSFKTNISHLAGKTDQRKMIINIVNEQYQSILSSYLDTMTRNLLLWITNMVQTESTKRDFFVVNNIARIHSVQDLLTLLNQQLDIINQYFAQLKQETIVKLINVIFLSVDKFAELLLDYIQKNMCATVPFTHEYFCALLNSSYFITIKLKTHLQNLLLKYNCKTSKTDLENLLDAIIFKFTNIAKVCSIQIGENMVKNNIQICECFTTSQLRNDESDGFIKKKILILKNQCEILEKSIEEKYFFNQIIKSIINNMTSEYIESILTLNKMNAKQLSNCIEIDIDLLNEYFNTFENEIQIFWSNKCKLLNAICAAFVCEDGFFETFTQQFKDSKCYDELIKFIKKKRRMQSLINKTSSLRLKIKNISFKKKGNDS